MTGVLLNKSSRHLAAVIWPTYIHRSEHGESRCQFKISHAWLGKKWSWFAPVYCIWVITLANIYSTRQWSSLTYKYDKVAGEQNKLVVCRCVRALTCLCTRMWHWITKVQIFFPKAIVIEADRGIFHDHRSRRQVIEHSRNRQLRNHSIAVPPGIIYYQSSVIIWVYF